MKTTDTTISAQHSISLHQLTLSLLVVVLVCLSADLSPAATPTGTTESLFDGPPPATADDEVFLASTRAVGTVCESSNMSRKLQCQRLEIGSAEQQPTWKTTDWQRLLSPQVNLPTVVYVHGNRVASGQDRAQGMQVYRSMKAHSRLNGPVRFIIWSWPSAQIPGIVRDYRIKAQRTTPAAWQLAWVLDKLPVDTQISLIGYSYGTRIVSGAAHLLAGGTLGNLKLTERTHPQRPRVRGALLAAAFDANWIQPGQYYGRSLAQFERLVLSTNELDPAMRFYHLSNGRGRMDALGKSGVHQLRTLGNATRRLLRVDFSREVARSHALRDYLAAGGKMSFLWSQLTTPDEQASVSSPIEQGSRVMVQNEGA